MKCPVDQAELQMTERQAVEIDYCPKCRGVWLDRGELDKIIERGGASETRSNQNSGQARGGGDEKRERGGWLGDLLDF